MRLLNKKNAVLKVFLGTAVVILVHLNLSAWFWYNDTEISFDESQAGISSSLPQESTILRHNVIEGANFFLKSYSNFLEFLSQIEAVELNGLNVEELQLSLTKGIENIVAAKDAYVQLKQKADILPYNSSVMVKLLDFNYDAFRRRNALVEPVFEDVKYYLQNGEVRELYGTAISDMEEILNIAESIKTKLEAGETPELSSLYSLNEVCSKSLLFGQYAARVFQEIK